MNFSARGTGCGTRRSVAAADGLGRRYEGSREDLPGESRLGHEAQDHVAALTAQVVAPLADLLVLQPLHQSESVEEDKERDEDPDDKCWDLGYWQLGGDKKTVDSKVIFITLNK